MLSGAKYVLLNSRTLINLTLSTSFPKKLLYTCAIRLKIYLHLFYAIYSHILLKHSTNLYVHYSLKLKFSNYCIQDKSVLLDALGTKREMNSFCPLFDM